eukprot:CAMPEP_0201595938 /NCGR_PEP_ID=MMETSP0190_2-20130828/192774_1 /ASSEMBLY_ACC=CAM_ASM_000263 /TAXON_ID=37353 /ORGANISM="Rosalina sp." /LENGTH=93 /DNA_ID=CAMNT_0048056093 /DNA_START=1159 /DNA_END=1440 /DNA_ORIENTATION=-
MNKGGGGKKGGGGDIDDDNPDYDEELGGNRRGKRKNGTPGPNGRGRGGRHRDPVSFDRGFCKNVMMFWTGNLDKEWQMPYPCVLKDSDTEDSD